MLCAFCRITVEDSFESVLKVGYHDLFDTAVDRRIFAVQVCFVGKATSKKVTETFVDVARPEKTAYLVSVSLFRIAGWSSI